MRVISIFILLALVAPALAGCVRDNADSSSPSYVDMGFDGTTWPRLDGVTLTILDHGAFGAFDDAKAAFENLTGAKVEHVAADDTGSALNRAILEKGAPTFDIIYGIDNILYTRAVESDIFTPYKPLLADRIDPAYLFFDAQETWHATPVDHGYIGINVDTAHPAMANITIDSLDDVRTHANLFVTQDPRTSTPGLGFLLATIATYPAGASPSWQDYWKDLFANGVLITSGWTEAYENHFSGGYGADYGGRADKPIVTSYTESPAYEHFFGRAPEALATPLTAPSSTFHQIQTMGIAKGTKNLAAAQAWIEFSLTDAFQQLAAPGNAVYPVVASVSVESTFGGVDPAPGSFTPAAFDAATLGANVERWISEWVDLCEAANCA